MAIALTFQGFKADDTNQTTYTFTSCPVGSGTRKIVINVLAGIGSGITLSSVTVDSNTMTSAVTASAGTNEFTQQFYYDATGATGSSVTIVVTWSGAGVAACHIEIYTLASALAGGPSSTVSTNSATLNTLALTSNCTAGGAIIGGAIARDNTIGFTWVSLTKDYDAEIDGAGSGQPGSTASAQFATSQTGLAITASLGGSVIRGIYGVTTSWAPAAAVAFSPTFSSWFDNPNRTEMVSYG